MSIYGRTDVVVHMGMDDVRDIQQQQAYAEQQRAQAAQQRAELAAAEKRERRQAIGAAIVQGEKYTNAGFCLWLWVAGVLYIGYNVCWGYTWLGEAFCGPIKELDTNYSFTVFVFIIVIVFGSYCMLWKKCGEMCDIYDGIYDWPSQAKLLCKYLCCKGNDSESDNQQWLNIMNVVAWCLLAAFALAKYKQDRQD